MVFGFGLHWINGMDNGFEWDVRNVVCLACRLPKCSVELDLRNRTQTENKLKNCNSGPNLPSHRKVEI